MDKIDQVALATDLNKIYNPAIVSWQIKVHENQQVAFNEDEDPRLATGKGTTAQFNKELRNVVRALEHSLEIEKSTKDHPVLNIVVVADLDAENNGYMPLSRDWGFVEPLSQNRGAAEVSPFSRLIAHELGHGAFALRHSWEQIPETSEGTSDNLMDYGAGIELTKRQWDQIHDSRPVLGFMEKSEGAGSIAVETRGKPIRAYFDDLITDGLFIPFLTPGHTRIILPVEISDPVFFHGIESDNSEDIYTGCLMSFSLDGVQFTAKISAGMFWGYYAGSDRYPSALPELAGRRSKELVSIVYPCGALLHAESFEVPSLGNYPEGETAIVSEAKSDLRLFSVHPLIEGMEFSDIQGLLTGEQSGISETEVEMSREHCHKETAILVSKIAQFQNRYPAIFHQFTTSFDQFFEAISSAENSGLQGGYSETLGRFEKLLRDDNVLYQEVEELYSEEAYQFYIFFLEEFKAFIEEYEGVKSNCIADVESIGAIELYECMRTFSDDEIASLDAITKFLIIGRFIDIPVTSNQFEQQIIRIIKYFGSVDQADELYVLLRNDLVSDDQSSVIKRLFFAVDDDVLFGTDDRLELMKALVTLCTSSRSFNSVAEAQANRDDFKDYSYIYNYQPIWKDIIDGATTYPVFHIESEAVIDDNGMVAIRQALERGFDEVADLGIQHFHALQPLFFINKSQLGQLSNYDDLGQIVPAIIAKYSIASGSNETIMDVINAGVDLASLGVGFGALQLGISGLRKGIILADMVSAGVTLTLEVTDADAHLNEDALAFLRSAALITSLIGAADVVDLKSISQAFSYGQQSVRDLGVLDDFTTLRREAERLCDQIIDQPDLSRLAVVGSERLEGVLFETEKLLAASQAAGDAALTTKLRYGREKLLRIVNDLDGVDDYAGLLKSRFPVLARTENSELLSTVLQKIEGSPSLEGLVELGTSMNKAARGLTAEKQLLLFRFLADADPLSDIFTTYPHLFRFEPWSWPTGPPTSLVGGLEDLQNAEITIFERLFKEGGEIESGLDLSGSAAANTEKFLAICEDMVADNSLFEFFGRGGNEVKAWEGLSNRLPWVRTNIDLLKKLAGKGDEYITKVEGLYSPIVMKLPPTLKFPNGIPPGSYNGVDYDRFGFPKLESHVSDQSHVVRIELDVEVPNNDYLAAYDKLKDIVGEGNIQFANQYGSSFKLRQTDGTFDGPAYTWHHHQDGETMMPVLQVVHQSIQSYHTGGRAVAKRDLVNLFDAPKF